jgi:lipoteichoic acid synthase
MSSATLRAWVVDGVPFIAILTVVWAKVVYASLVLPTEYWSGMGASVDPLRALMLNPGVGLVTLALLLALLTPLALVPRGWRFLGLLLADFSLTMITITDVVHVRFYADVASVRTVVLAPTLVGFMPTVRTLLRLGDVMYVVDLAIVAALVPAYLRLCRRSPPLPLGPRIRAAAAALVVGLALAVPTMWLIWHQRHDLFSPAAVRIDAAAALGILPYHLADAALHLRRRDRVVTEGDRERVHRYLAQRRRHQPSALSGVARGRNVIVMSAESLQAFPIGLELMGQAVTPNLTAFARESLNFVNIYDQTHLGTTADAEFMVMQSLYPLPVGVVTSNFTENHYRGVPAILTDLGYTTLSACAAPGDFWEMERMHPRLGFQKSYFEDRYAVGERIGPWLADREFFSQTVKILAAQPEPFMAFLLSASNHHPYDLPSRHRQLRLGTLEGTLLGDYLHSVHYFDAAFGEFVVGLRDAGLLDRTVVLIYGDHQGFLGDPPALAHLLGYAQGDEYRRLAVRKKVPLLIRLPHGQAAGVQLVTGGHVDVAPTLLSLLGVGADAGVMLGEDLTRGEDSLVVFRDSSFVDGTHHLVRQVGRIARFTCYEVKTGRVVDCHSLEDRHRAALERLKLSDTVIRGDLIPELTAGARAGPAP